MKFAQLTNEYALTAGSSHRVSFSADNVQGIMIKTDDPLGWSDLYLNVNVGTNFSVARCSVADLLAISAFNTGYDLQGAGNAVVYIDLGSIWLTTNETLECHVDNDGSTTKTIDITCVYNCDYPANVITYQNIIDSNFSRDNIAQIWAFGEATGDLSECEDVLTLQNDFGSQSTKVKVFNAWTNTQQNSEAYNDFSAQVYTDPDGILTKVTASITALYDASTNVNGVSNFIVVANDTSEEEQVKLNQKYLDKKKGKLNLLPMSIKRLNRLKGLL